VAVLATSNNRVAAQLVGVDTKFWVMTLSFALSAGIGALAGVLVTPITLTSYDVGLALALKGFAAAMLGGMGNPKGALVGGILLGVLEGADGGIPVIAIQGRGGLHRHPGRPVLPAARPLRPQGDGSGVTMKLSQPNTPRCWCLSRSIALAPMLSSPPSFYYRVGALIFVNSMAVIGIVILTGYAGQISLGHAGFAGIGAYACALAPVHLGDPARRGRHARRHDLRPSLAFWSAGRSCG
jgi:ABC-type branched-subunit amino acid transport system permease subunit